MTTSVYDVQQGYISLIKSNVSDPNNERSQRNGEWVYDDIPVKIAPGNFPRVLVLPASQSLIEPHEIGSLRQRSNIRIEVQIRVMKSNSYKNMNATAYVNYLGIQILDALRLQASVNTLQSTLGIFQVFEEQENTMVFDDLIVKSMIFKNILVR